MRSMTGCGMGSAQTEGWEVTAELKTVNHRFLDISLRLPRTIAFLEPVAREEISRSLRRGHVDVYLTVKNLAEASMSVETDVPLAKAYLEAAERLRKEAGAKGELTVERLMQLQGVVQVTEPEMNPELLSRLCREALKIALVQVTEMREQEGENLQKDLSVHLELAASLRESIQEEAPRVVREYRNRLESRLQAMLTEGVEPQRLAQEVAIMADRCAIDEELARLMSHFSQMRAYLLVRDEIGKKMDFLIQEMNREANTIGSKASDAVIAQHVVNLKSEIEKMREQVQNVE